MIRVAILGAGVGREHLDGYRQLTEQFTVSVLCDLNSDRAQKVANVDSAIRVISDIALVLSDPQIDLVDVCLPPHLHASVVIDALEAGKHVICEKPIGRSLAEVQKIGEAVERARGLFFPVFQYRYGLAMNQLMALRSAGLTGHALVASAETHWDRDSEYYSVAWRGTWSGEVGGAVLGHAIHCHDLICHILGPVSEVSAFTDTRVNDIEVEDCAAINLRMNSGALVTSSVTLGSADDSTRLRLCFEKLTAQSGSSAYAPMNDTWSFSARGATSQEDIDRVLMSVTQPHSGFTGYLSAVCESVKSGAYEQAISFEDGRRSIELVTAIYLSTREKRPISLPLKEGCELYNGWQPSLSQ